MALVPFAGVGFAIPRCGDRRCARLLDRALARRVRQGDVPHRKRTRVLAGDLTSTVDHFGPNPFTNIINLSVSKAGTIFALDGQSNVYEYNASTLALEHTFAIKFQQNEVVAGMSDGSFYVATAQGEIDHYSATGTLLKSITVTNNLLNGITTPDFFDSIAINEATGQIALGTANHGQVVLTDLALDTPTAFVATDPTTNFDSGNVHVAWVTAAAVPEPSTLTLLGIAAGLLAAHPRFRAANPKPRARTDRKS
jgi:hypothetical protein